MKVLVLRYSELSQRAPFRTSLTQPFLSEAYYSDEEDTENTGDLSDDQSVVSYHQTYTHTYTHTVTRTHTQKHTLITRTQKHTLITLLLSLITRTQKHTLITLLPHHTIIIMIKNLIFYYFDKK